MSNFDENFLRENHRRITKKLSMPPQKFSTFKVTLDNRLLIALQNKDYYYIDEFKELQEDNDHFVKESKKMKCQDCGSTNYAWCHNDDYCQDCGSRNVY